MKFDKKYVYDFTPDYYVWFGDCEGKVHYGVDEIPFANIPIECDFINISLNNMGEYDEEIYIHFGDAIYKTDKKVLSASIIADNVYDVHFLEKCIMAMKKKDDRFDEMIKIIPYENKIISMGFLQKENILR